MKTVQDYLDENKGRWFRATEIVDTLGFKEMSVRNALRRLLVKYPEQYEKGTLNGFRVWRARINEPNFARIEYHPRGEGKC